MHWIIDAHEDLAYNMLTFGRDYRRSALETRRLEVGTPNAEHNCGECTIGWPEYQQGQVAVVFATLFAAPKRYSGGEWDTQSFVTPAEAHRLYQRQLELYRRLADESPDKFRLVFTRRDLQEVLAAWEAAPAQFPGVTHPTGLVVLIEGAEGMRDPEELEEWWQAGARILGPVWSGTRWCGGTNEPGGFTREGRELLEVMAGLGFVLDVSHMNEESSLEALDRYEGRVIASHANARALHRNPRGERQLTDASIRRLIERDGVMGVLPYNRFIQPGWLNSDPPISLHALVDIIDHICQLAGDSRHAAIGSDLDGGFGWPAIPHEMQTVADFQKLAPILLERGYNQKDVANIMGENWRRILEETLPAA